MLTLLIRCGCRLQVAEMLSFPLASRLWSSQLLIAPDQSLVQTAILPGRTIPGEVFLHPVLHQLLPLCRLRENRQSPPESIEKRLAGVGEKFEPRPLPRGGIVIFNRIVQSSRGAHHGDGA